MTDTADAVPRPKRAPAPARAEAILEHIVKKKGGARRHGQVSMARGVSIGLSQGKPTLIEGGTGIGKALDVDTLIPTPNGFVRMGDLKVGDQVFDELGKVCSVTAAYDVLYNRKCFELEFSNGGTLIADAEHLFNTISHRDSLLQGKSGEDLWDYATTVTTQDILETLRRSDRPNHRIPVAKPLELPDVKLPIAPYELGYWLGVSQRRSLANGQTMAAKAPSKLPGFDLQPVGTSRVNVVPSKATEEKLAALGLLIDDRFIPQQYLFASEAQRRALLAGFLDATGTADASGTKRKVIAQVSAYKTQGRLIADVRTLASSLGMRASATTHFRKSRGARAQSQFWTVAFTPDEQVFRDPAKQALVGDFNTGTRSLVGYRTILDVRAVESRPVRCISVDSPRNLYLAGEDFIPTHNSLGYIAGALASEKRTGVAPHTKALQDQLAADLDLVVSAFADYNFESDDAILRHAPTYAIVKGRSAYFCGNKNAAADNELAMLDDLMEPIEVDSEVGQEIATLMEWSHTTETGDRAEAPVVSTKAWLAVAGSSDECSANNCKSNPSRCFAELAHERAKDVDIVIINQSYLATAMKIEFMGLDVDAVVVDEAHEFPNTVADVFGAVVKRKRIEHTVKRTSNILQGNNLLTEKAAKGFDEDSEKGIKRLFRLLEKTHRFQADRAIVADVKVIEAIKDLRLTLEPMMSRLQMAKDRASDDQVKATIQVTQQSVVNLVEDLRLIEDGSDDFQVCWAELENGQPVLKAARFDVADTIHEHLIDRMTSGSVVMTSATLTVEKKFDHPAQQMGFQVDPETYPWSSGIVESPFNYREQGLVWLPDDMPEPANNPEAKREYALAVADVAATVARAAGGRTMVLCTSKESMELIAAKLTETLAEDNLPVLVQKPGEPPKPVAKAFADDPRAVLVGTRTFWTGVSIDGDTCVAVVIDKVPFPTPTNPIVAARSEKIDRVEGPRTGFMKVSLVEAILTMVQGTGRLIRTVNDRGVVVVCDPRLNPKSSFKKSYWKKIASSLPPFSNTSNEAKVVEFLQEINRTATDVTVEIEVDVPVEMEPELVS